MLLPARFEQFVERIGEAQHALPFAMANGNSAGHCCRSDTGDEK